ncbi:DUF748 domain-containing protein [Bdellovibrio sp. HCB2-146]|uniref:DUF748 domain-containing protein n=1 Tax=Bdellovibrio sp. HCB2-146 TaxID=3394362 RepID=UPI0039BC38FB
MTKTVRNLILACAGVLALYTLAGFFLVPYIAKQQGKKIIAEKLGARPKIDKISFNPFTFKATVEGFDLPEVDSRAGEGSRLKFKEFTLQLVLHPLFKKELRFKMVAIKDLQGKAVIFQDETTNWAVKKELEEEKKKDEGKPWILTLERLEIDRSGLTVIDKTHVRPMDLPLGPFTLRANHLSTSLGSETSLRSLDILVGEAGHLKIHGTFSPSPLTADLDLDFTDLPLYFLSAYLSDATILALKRGSGDLKGKLKYGNGNLTIVGESAFKNLAIGPAEGEGEDAVAWSLMSVHGIDFSTKPLRLLVDEINLKELKTRIVLEKDGRLNVRKYMRQTSTSETAAETPAASAEQASPPIETASKEKSKFDYLVKKLTVEKGILDYADETIQPRFSVHIHNVNGTVLPISPQTNQKINVNLNGQIEAYGKFKGKGFYIPADLQALLNFDMNFHNIELTTFTPYSGKFAGYEISKGKLFLDINYSLAGTRIKGKNKVLLDQFTLGDKVDSEKAGHWPLKFALALAKDRKGQIQFQLPVQGDIKDPSFSWGSLIWTALKNLVVKIVASPFDFIASLVGGGKDMQWVYFEPGTADLAAGEEAKIEKLAEALKERPSLALEIRGEFQTEDIDKMKSEILDKQLEPYMKRTKGNREEAIVALAKRETRSSDFKRFEISQGRPDVSKLSQEIEKEFYKTAQVPEDRLRDLGLKRGNVVMAALAQQKIENERMYLLATAKGEAGKQPHVFLNLKEIK